MKILFLTFFGALVACANVSQAQPYTYVPGIAYYYDAAGNRILRQPGMICIDCPKPPPHDTVKDAPVPITKQLNDINTHFSVVAYPNPAENILFVENRTWKAPDKASISVFDVTGKVVLKNQFSEANFSISFADFIAGTYVVQYFLNGLPAQIWHIVKL